MDEVLSNLILGEELYITQKGTRYLFYKRNTKGDLVYSINTNHKTLPIQTINAAIEAYKNGVKIDTKWYKSFNNHEYLTRSCNLSILKELLRRISETNV